MPKISTNNSIKIETEKFKMSEQVDVHYNKEVHFYIQIPDKYSVQFDSIESIPYTCKIGKFFGQGNDPRKKVVHGASEKEVLERAKEVFIKLASTSMEERNVIVVQLETHGIDDLSRKRNWYGDIDRPNIGLELQMTYATEVSVLGQKPKYYKYANNYRFGEDVVDRHEVNDGWRKNPVIPDTPENRQFLENIHEALIKLTTTMKEYTETPEKILEMINSNQKLIG